MVMLQLPKLATPVRFRYPAPFFGRMNCRTIAGSVLYESEEYEKDQYL